MNTSNELAPCPKCGGHGAPEQHLGTGLVVCQSCGHRGPEAIRTQGLADRDHLAAVISAWNAQAR
jgi:DNA-directed RNA polymerase subunit RPC12/RpoP